MKKENAETRNDECVRMKMSQRHCVLCVAAPAVFFCALLTAYASTNLVSRPVGVTKISVASDEQKLVSLPFKPLDPSLNAVLTGLTGSTNEATADAVLKWDAVLRSYLQALKADGTEYADTNGEWFADLQWLIPTDLTLEPGEGFFLWNKQGTNQSVFLAGEVVLEETNAITLLPGPNLIGYPYSSAAPDSPVFPASNTLFLGQGIWFNNTSDEAVVWAEVRPYADEFPKDDEPPLISGIRVDGRSSVIGDRLSEQMGEAVTLTIVCEGAAGETLDIFYQDLSPTGRLDTLAGWNLAATNIAVNGRGTVEWTDGGDENRCPASESGIRYYLAGRADLDLDNDGVPDAREKFVLGHRAIGREIPRTIVPSGVSSNAPAASVSPVPPEAPVVPRGGIIYVDARIGDDNWSGLSASISSAHGPKRTIRAAMRMAEKGATISVAEGVYVEKVVVDGVKLTTRGRVVIH